MHLLLFENFYQALEDWHLDKNNEVMANRLVTSINKFGNIISFACLKQLLELM